MQDNTIADRPVVELVTSLNHMLDKARHSAAAGSLAPTALSQLVLIVSDGRFHEKESLRRIVVVSLLSEELPSLFLSARMHVAPRRHCPLH